ncbi:YrrS family protein [Virgibacillus sp. JSM 102003]|uniref:YrrS family protein n=1 Tax=Virgibacillus sp. JSM 102003 TaxID=1562108 RepID=UPI0035C1B29F
MSDFNDYSRVDKFEKRRKNTKSLSVFLVLGSLLLIVLIGVIIFGGDDEGNKTAENQSNNAPEESEQAGENPEESTSNEEEQSATEENGSENNSDSSDSTNETDTEEKNNNSEVETEQAEPSDGNVTEAYTGNWKPVGTEQTGQHTINFKDGSQDRKEMRKAAAVATGLDEESLIMWWVSRDGNQKVLATVSNSENTEVYRAYLTWVEDQGWKPTKVEKLKENDQEYRFE